MTRVLELDRRDDDVVRELLAPLARVRPVALRRRPERHGLRRLRPVLVAAAAVVALAVAGVGIAAGFGAFDNLSAAQHPQTSADLLNPQTAAGFEQLGCGAGHVGPDGTFVPYACDPGSSRLLSTLPDGDKLYVLQDTAGQLCVYLQGTGLSECGNNGLDAAHPVMETGEDSASESLLVGVAMDGVTSVSFTVGGREVTVPVEDNAWAYEGPGVPYENGGSPFATCITAHFADGSTVPANGAC
jgi:hypothetical protein